MYTIVLLGKYIGNATSNVCLSKGIHQTQTKKLQELMHQNKRNFSTMPSCSDKTSGDREEKKEKHFAQERAVASKKRAGH